jgi:glycosyltransferase involved in cell wall biosynthesis
MLRIARVVHSFYDESAGDYFGTNELSQKQVRLGHEVRLFTWSRSGKPSVSGLGTKFVVMRLRGVNLRIPPLFDDYPYLPTLGRQIATAKPDVIHAHSHLFLTTLQAGVAAKRAGLPFIVTVHGVIAKRGALADSLQTAYLHSFGMAVFRLASRVVCVSRGDVREIVRLGCPEGKIRLVPNAVDSWVFRPQPLQRRKNEILWVGRFVPEKGIQYLLTAFNVLLKKREAMLRLVGDGPTVGRMEGLARRLGIAEHVVFEGRVSKSEVARLMAEATIFVLPSVKEGLPKALLQAMSSGLPVVASDIPGVTDVIADGKNGLLFRTGDEEGLAESILSLMADENLARILGNKGRETVDQNYNWESTLSRLDRVYEEAQKDG